jgi:hypothetical protein
MTPYLFITALLFIAAINIATAKAADPPKGEVVSNTIVATWNCQDKLPQHRTAARSPWKHHTQAYWARELNLWTNRLTACRAILTERARQWNWQAWLPDKWRRIGQCETQLNWQHQNSSYEGAFGFATSSWDAFKPAGYPDHASQASPWQQYQVALAIYNRYGLSGWGCRDA